MDINEKDIEGFKESFLEIKNEIGKAIIGQEDIIEQVLIAILCEGNVLLEGVPGLGKTQLVKTIGRVLDLDFSRIQFTPDLMPADVVGTNIVSHDENGKTELSFQKGPIFSNIVLADEINRATPKTQSAMLEAMQEKTVTVGNNTYSLTKPFFVMATQNPIEMEGTYPLPEAQMDRFIFKLNLEFPNLNELTKIVEITTGIDTDNLEKVTSGEKLISMSNIAKNIPIATSVINYAMKLILSTHPENESSPEITKKYIRYGSSPRGAQAIVKGARVKALIEGRYNVSYDDIKYMAYPVLRHRVVLNFDAISENITPDDYIKEVIDNLEL
ncbi:AAA family ATPase [Tissierella creatinophila]|uniref:ATPase family associated with various cellular activitie (AAA) n=1 Tax=Tissierella creatinophila DSM 6911 TaxID=1123403 RepID=A0A1U7M7L0_TISCR|nr:MoxR family ATPase [Tissierella creatinophila]OLS03271.1 ATPase family associated with various cellular activitie (AAA) [Tissierella creatinophila DSM 6911]